LSLWHPEKIKFAKFSELAQLKALFFRRAESLGYDGGDSGYIIYHIGRFADHPFNTRMTPAATAGYDVWTWGLHDIARLLRMPPNGVGGKLCFECRVKLESITDVKFKMGFDLNTEPEFRTYQHAAINYESDVSPYWRCSSYGTAQELTTTTVAADTAWHVFSIGVTGSYVKFYIDGVLVATHTAQIPNAGLPTYMNRVTLTVETLGAVYKWLRYEYVAVWNEGM